MNMPKMQEFRDEIMRQKSEARKAGKKFVNLTSRDIHLELGGYPGKNHRMPSCCHAMYDLMKTGDEVIKPVDCGYGASLTIKYYL